MRFIQVAVIVGSAIAGCQAQNNVSKWDALSGLQGKEVALMTTEGAGSGYALRWQPESLSLQIRKSTDVQAFPMGQLAVPRQNIRTIEVSRSTKKWRVIGTAVGLAVGLLVAAASGFSASGGFLNNDHQTRGTWVAFVTLGGLTAGGFLVGWALDHRKTVIVVNP